MTFYVGKVTKVLEDKATIYFTIPKVCDIPLIGYPIVELSRVPEIDDELMILQIDDAIPLYYYFVSPTTEHTGEVVLRYDTIKVGIDIKADDGKGMVNIIKSKDNVNYSLKDLLEKLLKILMNFRTTGNSSAQTIEKSLKVEVVELKKYMEGFIGGFENS